MGDTSKNWNDDTCNSVRGRAEADERLVMVLPLSNYACNDMSF